MNPFCLSRLFCAALVFLCAALPAWSQADYPARTVRIIVSFAPGGNADAVARMVADELSTLWGKPVIVENRPGAGGTIGTGYAAKQPADGYTLHQATSATNGIAPSVYSQIPYDPLRDFAYIAPFAFTPNVLLVNPKLPVSNLQELVAHARANRGKLNYSTPGVGLTDHLMMELLLGQTGMEVLHVPYKGSAEARTATMTGEVHMTFATVAASIPQVRSGALKAVAVSGRQRSAMLPEVPTVAEAGIKGFEAYTWTGLAAPAGTPPEIIAKIHRDVASILKQPRIVERVARTASESLEMSPEEFRSFVAAELKKWRDIARRAGVKME